MSLSFYFFLLPTLPPQICRLVVSCFGLPLFPLLLSLDLSGLHAKPPRVNICVCTPHHATNQSVSINNSAVTAKERKKQIIRIKHWNSALRVPPHRQILRTTVARKVYDDGNFSICLPSFSLLHIWLSIGSLVARLVGRRGSQGTTCGALTIIRRHHPWRLVLKKKRGKKTILCVDERRREMGKDFVGIKKKKEDGR